MTNLTFGLTTRKTSIIYFKVVSTLTLGALSWRRTENASNMICRTELTSTVDLSVTTGAGQTARTII